MKNNRVQRRCTQIKTEKGKLSLFKVKFMSFLGISLLIIVAGLDAAKDIQAEKANSELAALAPEAIKAEDNWLILKYERGGGSSESKQEKTYKTSLQKYLKQAVNLLKKNKNDKTALKVWNREPDAYSLVDVEYPSEFNRSVEDRKNFVKANNKLKFFYDTGKIRI